MRCRSLFSFPSATHASRMPLSYHAVYGRPGSVWATLTNTNSNVKKKFYFEFTNCENVDFSEGKTVSVVLEPGEQKKIKSLACDC